MLREQSARLTHSIDDPDALVVLLQELAVRFHYGCSVNPRKKNPILISN